MTNIITSIICTLFALSSCTTMNSAQWSLSDDGTLTLKSDISAMNLDEYPWHRYRAKIRKIIVNDGVTTIYCGAFANCQSLESITFASTLTNIEDLAFYDCKQLRSPSFNKELTRIGREAFGECTSIDTLLITASLKTIMPEAFILCTNIKHIEVEVNNESYDSRDNCNALIDKSDNSLILGCCNTVIPRSVSSIAFEAFKCCGIQGHIVIPEGVTKIGSMAFYKCDKIESVTLPSTLTEIAEEAFYGCESLQAITIPASTTIIGQQALASCNSLTSMNVERDNTTYDSRNNCNAIIHTATNTLVAGCNISTIPPDVTTIGTCAFFESKKMTELTLNDNITSIASSAFSGCEQLKSIRLPQSLRRINFGTFDNCRSITSISIPENVKVIDDYAFFNCTSITDMTLPNTVDSIGGNYIFSGCDKLSSVTIHSSTPPALTDQYGPPFRSKVKATLYVPSESIEAYKKADYWKNFKSIKPISEP